MLRFFVLACALGAIQAMIIPEATTECGNPYYPPKDISSLIVGGTVASPHSWPWQTLVLNRNGAHMCGASIIDDQWIVCAGHCFGRRPKPADYSFVLGAHNKLTDRDYTVTAETIIVHEDYSGTKLTNDIALIKLSQPITFSDTISPACLVNERPQDGSMAYVTGWGTTSSGGSTTTFLNQVGVPIVSDAVCTASYGSEFYPAEMVCAGYPEGGKDSCQGDSGGPMVVQNRDGYWELAGVVSWGYGCAQAGNYGVYTNVVNYLDWIADTMASN
nr:trypsin-like [Lytechinus pictus]